MSKSKDLREAAVKYRLSEHTLEETAEVFGVSKSAVSSWVNQYEEMGDLSNKPLNRGFKKIDPKKLTKYVQNHPDATQKEMAEFFECSNTAIGKALKRNGITRKKRHSPTKNKIPKK